MDDLPEKTELLRKIINLSLAAILLRSGFDMFWRLNMTTNLAALITALLMYASAFVLIIDGLSFPPLPRRAKQLMGAMVVISFVLFVVMSFSNVQRFGTDGILFNQYAIDLLLSGENPYAQSMEPAFNMYGLDERWVTLTADGNFVRSFSYPALSFVIYIPLLLVGVQDINVTTMLFLLAVLFFLIREAPSWLRGLPVLILFIDPNTTLFSYGGVFDIVWVLFLLFSIKYFLKGKHIVSGIFLGLAFSVKQTPWLIAPFLAVWIYKTYPPKRKGRRMIEVFRENLYKESRFFIPVSFTFLLINAPFMYWNFGAWLDSVLTPLSGRSYLIMQGSGLASLVQGGHASLPYTFFQFALISTLITLLLLYWLNFERIKHIGWVAPMLIFFFHYRSLQNYFIFFIPVALYLLIEIGRERGWLGES